MSLEACLAFAFELARKNPKSIYFVIIEFVCYSPCAYVLENL